LFTLGSSLKITEVSHICILFCPCPFNSMDNFKHQCWQKMCLTTFGVIFAQTRLATLFASCNNYWASLNILPILLSIEWAAM
jgi:hypothetical protein